MNVYFIHVVPVIEHNYCWVKECPLYCYLWIHICFNSISYTYTVNTKTREHGSQSSRKLKMAPVRLKDGSHFGSRTFWTNKIVLMSP